MPGSTQKTTTRNIPALTLRAEIRPGSVNVEERTAELVFTTGARVRRGFWEPFDEELSLEAGHVRMERLQSGRAPLLDTHGGWSLRGQIGVIESATLATKDKEGRSSVRFSKRADVEPIFQDVVDGIIRNVSVGYRVHKYERVQEGEAQKTGSVPVYRAVDWEPYEVSLVPMPADAGASVRAAGDSPQEQLLPCEFISRSEETPMPDKTPTAATPVVPPAQPAADATRQAELDKAAKEAGAKEERERSAAIRQLTRAVKLEDSVAEKLISDGVSVDQARKAVLDQLAGASERIETRQHVRVEVGAEEGEKWKRGAGAWLIEKAGATQMVRDAKAKKPDHPLLADVELQPGEFRGMSLIDLARDYLEQRGVKTRGMDRVRLVERAFMERAGYQTTSDFAVLLENTLHKILLGAYATTPDTWSRWCGTESVTDFRDHPRYRLGSFGVLDALNEHGEFKNKQIPDGEKVSLAVGTKGNIIALTRQAIVNDDLGAFTGLAARLGRAGKLTIEVAVYALLGQNAGLGPNQADGQPFFHANRKNVNATGSAISVAGIDADRVVMATQTDPSGNEILELRPKVLLVPVGLGGEARVINDAQYDPDTANKLQRPNKVRGLFSDIVDTARLTGTRRYLLADPAIAPAFVVSFLNGQAEPVLETMEGWRVDGVEWKARLDFGVDEFDPRGAVTNAGV